MDMTLDSLQPGNIKRIRQACANCRYARLGSTTMSICTSPTDLLSPNCRRKKTKCSGERPICFHCRRNRLACVYEPYAATLGDPNPAPTLAPVNNPLNNVSQSPMTLVMLSNADFSFRQSSCNDSAQSSRAWRSLAGARRSKMGAYHQNPFCAQQR